MRAAPEMAAERYLRNSRKIHKGLRHVSASSVTLSLIMDDGTSVYLKRAEMARVLTEVAGAAPDLLRDTLERRLVALIAAEVAGAAWLG